MLFEVFEQMVIDVIMLLTDLVMEEETVRISLAKDFLINSLKVAFQVVLLMVKLGVLGEMV